MDLDIEYDLSEFQHEFDMEFTKQTIDPKYLHTLKTKFGHSQFRSMQWDIISSILERKQDNIAVMATGYGKSICFQFPSVHLDTVTIVVSPLISLMEDQVLSLTVSNIPACLLGTAQKDKSVLDDVLQGKYNIVYVTPELITCDIGSTLIKDLLPKLTLIAIDEAHCISKWGHDFRIAFRNLGVIRELAPKIPILAMTATATEHVQKDIISSLSLRNPQVVCTGFDRPNLEFNVHMKGKQGIYADIEPILKSIKTGSTIIYCLTRNLTEEIAGILQSHGINCRPYHAGLSLKDRKICHEEFSQDKIQIIVATIAFGMGIDKPDVRAVIHYGASKDIESYYQEVGRAGRDGSFSRCIMFYSRSDFQIHRALREKHSMETKNNLEILGSKMREYINTTDCRRLFILRYFDGPNAQCASRNNCCDNCKNNTSKLSTQYEGLDDQGLSDFTDDSVKLLTAIDFFNGTTGVGIPILFLRGSNSSKVPERCYSHEMHGAGKGKSEIWWKSLNSLLEDNGYLKKTAMQKGFFAKTFSNMQQISLTPKASTWLNNTSRPALKLKPSKDMFNLLKMKKSIFPQMNINLQTVPQKVPNKHEELLTALHRTRMLFASDLNVMPYMITSNKALCQLAQHKPMNKDELEAAKIDGFSESKIAKFGPAFIKCILEMKNFLPIYIPEPNSLRDFMLKNPIGNTKLTETHFRTFELWNQGKNVTQISQLRGLAESTISSYLMQLIKSGYCTSENDLRRMGVDSVTFQRITQRMPADIFNAKLKDIKEALPPNITYDMIKCTLSYCQLREHLKMHNVHFSEMNEDPFQSTQLINKTLPTSSKSEHSVPIYLSDDSDDIDLAQIDAAIEKNNQTISSSNSNDQHEDSTLSNIDVSLQDSAFTENAFQQDCKEMLNDGEDDLDLLISCINDEEKLKTPEVKPVEKVEVKRIFRPPKIIQYEDSDSDEREAHAMPLKKKKVTTGWLTTV